MNSQIVLPRILQIGAGASKEIGNILKGLGCSKPLIVTDKMMVQLGYVNRIQEHLPESEIYDDTVPEPTEESILAGVAMVRDGDFDSIIAIGGGSPIDSAKAISILGKHGGEMRDYMVPRVVNE
ncbi:MAG TPA: iron-containing alcohol dehydrogenase, partial [Pseudomonadales bacterium]|nr:iron-containing alcohol dehydrogenase [Pseudomonadales bacterium]